MRTDKPHLQNKLHAIGHRVLSATQLRRAVHTRSGGDQGLCAELDDLKRQWLSAEAEKAAAEDEHQALLADLAGIRHAFSRVRSKERQLIADLERRISVLESERNAAQQHVRELESSLDEASERQKDTERRFKALSQKFQRDRRQRESELYTSRAALARAQDKIQHLQHHQSRLVESFTRARQQLLDANQATSEAMTARLDAEQKAQQALRTKVVQLVRERKQAQQCRTRLEPRRTDLATALQAARQAAGTAQRLAGELGRHLEAGDQALCRTEWPLAEAAHDSESQQRPSSVLPQLLSGIPHPRRALQLRVAAGLPLLLGALASAKAVWDAQETPAVGTAVSKDIQLSVEQTLASLPVTVEEEPQVVAETAAPAAPAPSAVEIAAVAIEKPPVVGPVEDAVEVAVSRVRGSLFMADMQPASTSGRPVYDAVVQEQQRHLLALGFDLGDARADGLKGRRTEQALKEFELFYLPATGVPDISGEDYLASIVTNFAELAQQDQQKLDIDGEVLAAIQLSNLRTGVEFPFLMELAFVESAFNPEDTSERSSAAGLYQFTAATWLNMVKAHGEKYGLGVYASQIDYVNRPEGRKRPVIRNRAVRRHVLDLRYNARLSALMAAEFARENKRKLSAALKRQIGYTDLYLAHFFGARDATRFLKALDEHPDRVAAKLFPKPAKANPVVFNTEDGKPKTVAGVYAWFEKKFNTGLYEGRDPELVLVQRSEQQEDKQAAGSDGLSPG